jgi:hypothetical protein
MTEGTAAMRLEPGGLVIRWSAPDPADDPMVQRATCYCGSPMALTRHGHTSRWTISHGELELVGADEMMLLNNDHGRKAHEPVGIRLVRDVLEQAHTWLFDASV